MDVKIFSGFWGWLITKIIGRPIIFCPPYLFCWHRNISVNDLGAEIAFWFESGRDRLVVWLAAIFKKYRVQNRIIAEMRRESYLQLSRELYARIKKQAQ